MLKSNGPRIEPRGTPAKTLFSVTERVLCFIMLVPVRNIATEKKLILSNISNDNQ